MKSKNIEIGILGQGEVIGMCEIIFDMAIRHYRARSTITKPRPIDPDKYLNFATKSTINYSNSLLIINTFLRMFQLNSSKNKNQNLLIQKVNNHHLQSNKT
jgi:hypothetical protein